MCCSLYRSFLFVSCGCVEVVYGCPWGREGANVGGTSTTGDQRFGAFVGGASTSISSMLACRGLMRSLWLVLCLVL